MFNDEWKSKKLASFSKAPITWSYLFSVKIVDTGLNNNSETSIRLTDFTNTGSKAGSKVGSKPCPKTGSSLCFVPGSKPCSKAGNFCFSSKFTVIDISPRLFSRPSTLFFKYGCVIPPI